MNTRLNLSSIASTLAPAAYYFLGGTAHLWPPLTSRAYGFYAGRREVPGCHRIETLSRESAGAIWGNHVAPEERVNALGPAADLTQCSMPKSTPV